MGRLGRAAVLVGGGALAGCGAVDLGVQRIDGAHVGPAAVPLAGRFTRGETLVCAYDPPEPSPLFLSPLGPGARDADRKLQEVCPGLRREDIPRALLGTEQTVLFGLRGCRVTAIYKVTDPQWGAFQAEPQSFCAHPDAVYAVRSPDTYPRLVIRSSDAPVDR